MKKVLGLMAGILISISMLVFSACDNDYSKVQVVPSNNVVELAVGETKTINVQIENYFKEMSARVQINNPDSIVSIENEVLDKNKTTFTIKGLKVGTSTLNIKTFEGNKKCDITINVYQKATGFNTKTGAYILKEIGNQINFSQQNFVSLTPSNARSENIEYTYKYLSENYVVTGAKTINDNGIKTFLLITSNGTGIAVNGTEFQLTANVVDSGLATQDFWVNILNPIEVGDLNIVKKGIASEYLTEPELVQDKILLISNHFENSFYEFKLDCTNSVKAEFISANSEVITTNIESTDPTESFISFSMQAKFLGEETLKIKLYYENYPEYVVSLEYDVLTTSAPTQITANNTTIFSENITLFDYNIGTDSSYLLGLTIYSTMSSFESVDFEITTTKGENPTLLEDWDDYIKVFYKNSSISNNFSIPKSDFLNNSLKNNFYITGKKQIENLFIHLKINSEYLLDSKVEMFIPFEVKEGAETFGIDTTLGIASGYHIDVDSLGEQLDILRYTETTAHIGNLKFEYLNGAENYFEISQSQPNSTILNLVPIKVGSGSVNVILGNGLSTEVKFFVDKELTNAVLGVANNKNISQVKTDAIGNVNKIAVKYKEAMNIDEQIKIQLDLIINPNIATLYYVDYSLTQDTAVISYDQKTTSFRLTGAGTANLSIKVFKYEIENGLLNALDEPVEDLITGDITYPNAIIFELEIVSYLPIADLNFTSSGLNVSAVSTYREQDVGYYYNTKEKLATTSFSLNATLNNGTSIDDIFAYCELSEDRSIAISATTSSYTPTSNYIPNFGPYTREGQTYTLNCSDGFATAGARFGLAFKITEYNNTIDKIIYVEIKEYTPLYSIGFNNYVDNLYLSSSNPNYTFYTFMNPDADCQEFDVKFVADNAEDNNMFYEPIIAEDFSSVKIAHNLGTGKGTLYFIPRCAYTNVNYDFAYSQSVRVSFSDGSEEDNPLLISTAEEFVSAIKNSPEKHYLITTTLDFTDIHLNGQYYLLGTIKGASESAKLINLNVSGLTEDSNNIYGGLFRYVSGKITNLAFEGQINIQASNSKDNYIGLIAGKNSGLIQNCSVILKTSSIKITDPLGAENNGKQIIMGGLVGLNEGQIITNVKDDGSSFNHTLVNQVGTNYYYYEGYSIFAKVGGVCGHNSGIINRIVENQNTLYNDNINSAKLNISANGISYIGGIVGYAGNGSSVSGQLVVGNISSSRYNPQRTSDYIGGCNIGGIVGYNLSNITACTNRATLKGYDYVGGIVGFDKSVDSFAVSGNPENYRFITNCKVQAIKTATFTPLIMAINSNIVGGVIYGNVGSIAGNENANINQNIYNNNNNKATYYYTADPLNKIFPVMFGYINGHYTYAKYSAENEYYTLFRESTASIIIKEINETNGTKELKTENTDYEKKVALMFYYEAENKGEQRFVNSLNLNRQIPFIFENADTISITSLSTDILSINASGKVDIKNSGLATLVATSLLDETMGSYYLYVYVVNAFDGFSIGSSKNEPLNDFMMVVFENKPKSLSYYFTHKNIETRDNYAQNISVELKTNENASLEVIYDAVNPQCISVLQVGNLLTFTAILTGETETNTITLKPKFEVNLPRIGNAKISNDGELEELITNTTPTITLDITAKKGTEKINLSLAEITIQPIDEISVDITQITDYLGDYVKITTCKTSGELDLTTDYFRITSFSGYSYNALGDYYAKDATSGNFKFEFNYASYKNYDYEGIYNITFTADNGVKKTIVVNIQKQELSSITLKNYYSNKGDIGTSFDPTITQIDNMASGKFSLLVVEVYPYFADYDNILIKNDASNYTKNNIITFEVNKLKNDNTYEFVYGITYDESGVIIPKSVIESLAINDSTSKLYIRYSTTSKATVDSQAKIIVEVIKNNQVVYETSKTITVILKDNVSFTFKNRVTTGENIYVAKGMTYDLELNIYGYTEEQMVIEITTNPLGEDNAETISNAVSIRKENGEYKLFVNENVIYPAGQEGFKVKIATYGKNVINGFSYESGKSYLNIVIVDYVILTENISAFDVDGIKTIANYTGYTVMNDALNAVVNLSVGDSYDIGIDFVNGFTIEYDTTNSVIQKAVKEFANSMKNKGAWSVSANKIGVVSPFFKTLTLNETSELANEYLKITAKGTANNKTISVVPLKLNDYENPTYYFTYSGKFVYETGKPIFANMSNLSAFNLSTDFVFDVFPSSSEDNAIPITTYTELMAMEANAHYILLNNIALESDFTPISTNIASLDGNGYSIIYPSNLTFATGEDLGLFSVVSENTILKNIVIKIASQSRIVIESANSIFFGLLAGENLGAITNCSVECEKYIQLSVLLPNQTSEQTDNYVAGLVGHNGETGFISNSRVKLNITTIANLAGFVGINENKIASSYVKNSLLINRGSAQYTKTAGLVIKNGLTTNSKAQIIGSYVCGDVSSTTIYSTSQTYFINSNPMVGGFVFDNFCKITDCYSDIYIKSSATQAGFVFNNAGNITRCYSTSTFHNIDTSAYVFLCNNEVDAEVGTLNSCYYLKGNANAVSSDIVINGLTAFKETDFAKQTLFTDFAFSSNLDKTEAIWFYPSANGESDFTIKGANQQFTSGKPNLVSANILTYSQKAQDPINTTINKETNETIYAYYETASQSGSLYNPILISSTTTFENAMLNNAHLNVNNKHYRLIKDITYKETSTISSTSSIIFTGVLEGNGMKISNFTIDSKAKKTNGGLFAQIGQGYSNNGIVKDLVLAPKYLNFPNTQNVGTLAGLLEGGQIFNISADGFENNNDGVAIFGVNSVGGIIGVATNNFKMFNLSSSVSAKATYSHLLNSTTLGEFISASSSKNVSYAGTILGVANGAGTINNAVAVGKSRASAEIAGMLFGRIGKNIIVSNINQFVNQDQYINASVYGGIIAGQFGGNLSNVVINGEDKADFFRIINRDSLPTAVGAGFGLLTGGELSNLEVNYNLSWSVISPSVVGGIAGEMLGGNLFNVAYNGNFSLTADTNNGAIAKIVVGGIAGQLLFEQSILTSPKISSTNAVFTNVSTTGKINVNSISILKIYAGGIIGKAVNSYKVENTSATSLYTYLFNNVNNEISEININAVIYNGTMQTFIGGLVGASFADSSENYKGEIIISAVSTLLQKESTSKSVLNIKITDEKGNGSANVHFGGIMGFGYSVSSLTIANGISTPLPKNFSWGALLLTQARMSTNPSYNGQTYINDENIEVPYASMEDSEFLNFDLNCEIEKHENS